MRSRLRVLYSFPSDVGAPGIGSTAFHQVQELVRAGHDVHLVAGHAQRAVSGLGRLTETLAVRGRRLPHRAVGRRRAAALHDRRVAWEVRRRPDRYDVIHVWPGACLRTAGAARRAGVPCVREVPNTHTDNAVAVAAREASALGLVLPGDNSHHAGSARSASDRREYSAVTALLVPSEAVARTFLERGFDECRLLRHQYGYDPADLVPAGGPRTTGPLRALFLGRADPRKGLHLALRAWRSSAPTASGGEFRIVGSVVAGMREALGPLAEQPGVRWMGFSSDPAEHLMWADVLVLPSLEEGSALVSYEAQAAGCALLVSDAVGAVLQHGRQGLVHPAGDVDALTAQLAGFRSNPDGARDMGEEAAAAAAHLTWGVAGARLVAAYATAAQLVATATGGPS